MFKRIKNLSFSVEDARIYLTKQTQSQNREIASTNDNLECHLENNNKFEFLTSDDLISLKHGLPKITYDAYVLYADEDIEFTKDLVCKMEDCGFKVYEILLYIYTYNYVQISRELIICFFFLFFQLLLKDRDFIGGIQFEHEAIMHAISERCLSLIIIVSPDFLRSSANTFFTNYATALNIEKGKNKIFPCLYRECILPDTLRFYFVLNYYRAGKLYNFWDRLKDSLERAKFIDNTKNIRSLTQPSAPPLTNQQRISVENKRKQKLAAEKSNDRAMIREINDSSVVHEQLNSVHIVEIVNNIPLPPTTPPRSKSLTNLSTQEISGAILKSHTSLIEGSNSSLSTGNSSSTKDKSSKLTTSNIFRRILRTNQTTSTANSKTITSVDSSSQPKNEKRRFFRSRSKKHEMEKS